MPEQRLEDRLLREDIYEIENKLDLIGAKLACVPTQRDLTRVALLSLITAAIIVLFGIGALVRW